MKEKAALLALGALDSAEAAEFAALLQRDAKAREELSGFAAVTEFLARSLPQQAPSPSLKSAILEQAVRRRAAAQAEAQLKRLVPPTDHGLGFLRDAAQSGWVPLRVQGAFVKLLSFDPSNEYAIVLGKLEAGSRYPAHQHERAEDVYMLSGDLHIGEKVLHAGDFHHADAGSRHEVNWSENGCVLLAVLSKEDLLAQLLPA